MQKVSATKIKMVSFGLVRDKNGKPKINDYENCSDEIKAMLTDEERQFFENQLRGK